jgi:ankyrin repeat protein
LPQPDGSKLFYAAGRNDSALVLKLLKQGAELEWRNRRYGWTPLDIACGRGSYEAAEALCAHGAELDARSDSQGTPLIEAAYQGRTKICEMLLALGADPSLKSNSGKTALDWAREGNQPECAALLQPVTPGS